MVFNDYIYLHLLLFFISHSFAFTHPPDVTALQGLYRTLNYPPALQGWNGGDPCEESWTGVACSGSSVIHLNLSHNFLSGPIGNVFTGLDNFKEMDLSYNNFTGDLPSSFGSLTGLDRLFLQNNRFTGSVTYLAELPLIDLNIQDNLFSGILPQHFQTIPNLWSVIAINTYQF
ncbi:hypothetical protein Lal_00027815 [Lupinus albus]|nr:hypothetical protein Lal_00027815 [Lupinus albus]